MIYIKPALQKKYLNEIEHTPLLATTSTCSRLLMKEKRNFQLTHPFFIETANDFLTHIMKMKAKDLTHYINDATSAACYLCDERKLTMPIVDKECKSNHCNQLQLAHAYLYHEAKSVAFEWFLKTKVNKEIEREL